MKYVKTYENFESNPVRYFLRDTNNPEADIKRGFSCHIWKDTYNDALDFQKSEGAIDKPKYDEYSKRWCADPELGISSWSFKDETTYQKALIKMQQYCYNEEGRMAIFKSNDYDLDAGLDSEDLFRGGEFLGWITFDTKYADLPL